MGSVNAFKMSWGVFRAKHLLTWKIKQIKCNRVNVCYISMFLTSFNQAIMLGWIITVSLQMSVLFWCLCFSGGHCAGTLFSRYRVYDAF